MPMTPTIVCNNILKRAFEDGISVSPMKLQKLMYFVSCEYAKATGTNLLTEDFCVWQYGPVLPSIYTEFKGFGSSSITSYAKDANGDSYAIDEASAPNLREAINRVWRAFQNYNGIELSRITHQNGSGWTSAYDQQREKITLDDMKADHTYEQYMFL